jgi:hypothetical protein
VRSGSDSGWPATGNGAYVHSAAPQAEQGRQHVVSLIDTSNRKIRLSLELLERCQFVDHIATPNGEIITIPDK